MSAPALDSLAQPPRQRVRLLLLAGLVSLLCLAMLAEVFHLARQTALERIRLEAEVAARSRALAVESEFAKHRAVAAILADDTELRNTLANPSPEATAALSRKLDRLHDETASSVIYVLDRTGNALAASNWNEPVSFVGSSYAFRDYFTLAMRDGTAQQFALGTVSRRPGLYLSHVAGEGLGVVVVKVEFTAIEASWATSADRTFVTEADGRVVLASRAEARFQPMPLPEGRELSTRVVLPSAGWQLLLFSSSAPALEAAVFATGTAALGLGIVALGAGFAWRGTRRAARLAEAERRYSADLERAVDERTRALSDEMRERRATEQRLGALQADLVQANKLAALGQITAGVAHEVNQPLATIRLLAENGLAMLPEDRPAPPDVAGNLATIVRMAERIGHITAELRGFARKATGRTEPVKLGEAFEASLLLHGSRLRSDMVRVIAPAFPPGLAVMGDRIRLEQILVNLLQNAQDALADRPDPEIRVTLRETAETVTLSIADNGPGLSPEAAAKLFIPFTTTKANGLGLGLVIAHDIARDFGGSLRADPPVPGQGATFHLELRKA